MIFSAYFICFIIFSFLGWIYESAYCSIREHRWENRGFLMGPVVPIYGCGFIILMIVCYYRPELTSSDYPWYKIFLLCLIGSAILEYSTSFILEKLFNARWWDYSNLPLNINGRICLPASLAFASVGLLLSRYVIADLQALINHSNQYLNELISLVLMMIFGADIGLSINSIQVISRKINQINNEINANISYFYDSVEGGIKEGKEAFDNKYEELVNSRLARLIQESSVFQTLTLQRVRKLSFLDKRRSIGETLLKEVKKLSFNNLIKRRQNK